MIMSPNRSCRVLSVLIKVAVPATFVPADVSSVGYEYKHPQMRKEVFVGRD